MKNRNEDFGVCRCCGFKGQCVPEFECDNLKFISGKNLSPKILASLKFNTSKKHTNKK